MEIALVVLAVAILLVLVALVGVLIWIRTHPSPPDGGVPEPGLAETEPRVLGSGELRMGSGERAEYRKSKSVLTDREQTLLRALEQAVSDDYTILMKVRMGDFVWLSNEPDDRKYSNNQVYCKHVDFLLCSKSSLEPLLVIELDDSSHRRAGSAERDRFKDETFAAIDMPCLRLRVEKTYDAAKLGSKIREKMGKAV